MARVHQSQARGVYTHVPRSGDARCDTRNSWPRKKATLCTSPHFSVLSSYGVYITIVAQPTYCLRPSITIPTSPLAMYGLAWRPAGIIDTNPISISCNLSSEKIRRYARINLSINRAGKVLQHSMVQVLFGYNTHGDWYLLRVGQNCE
jgi:hypothetical protein